MYNYFFTTMLNKVNAIIILYDYFYVMYSSHYKKKDEVFTIKSIKTIIIFNFVDTPRNFIIAIRGVSTKLNIIFFHHANFQEIKDNYVTFL